MKLRPSLTFQAAFSLLRRPESRWLILFSVLPILVGSALAYWALQEKTWLYSLHFTEWILVFILLSIPIAFSLIPNTLAGILAGYILGFWGFPGMLLSFFLATLAGYFLGRTLDSGLKEEIFKIWPSARKSVENLSGNSLSVVIAFRLLPVPPFAIGNLLLAWLRMPLRPFLLGSLLGMIPRMALVVWLGANVHNILYLIQHPLAFRELQMFTLFAILFGLWLLIRSLKSK